MLSLDGGNIEIEMAPTQIALSNGEGYADYAAIASGPSGRMAVAWQEYLQGQDRDRLVCPEFDGNRWLAAETMSLSETRDVFRTALDYDGAGVLHLVWSAQADGNWDLYERVKAAGKMATCPASHRSAGHGLLPGDDGRCQRRSVAGVARVPAMVSPASF